ncbi:MAG: hypothetical protein ACK43N_23515, partial [Pirellulaceae bacterium]
CGCETGFPDSGLATDRKWQSDGKDSAWRLRHRKVALVSIVPRNRPVSLQDKRIGVTPRTE